MILVFLTGYKEPVSRSVEEPFTTSHNWPHLLVRQRQNWRHQHSLSVNSRPLFRLWDRNGSVMLFPPPDGICALANP